uniref:Myeloid leukemia factor n=1 Tax=Homalodisca liturata TaxID=320908 RepID=A0A1B6HL29_9HEMI
MSLFGSLLGDLDDDPFIGNHMRQMNRMMSSMNSMFSQPFGGLLGPGVGSELMPFGGHSMGGGLMPFGFPNMNHMFQNMDHMSNNPNCHSYSSSTVMTMTNGPDGRPQVYQASSSVRQGPGGVKETKKAVSDSRSGVKKLAIGHHIGDRAHIVEREQNLRTGDQEERQDYINLDEEEADDFNREWKQKTRHYSSQRAIHYPSADRYGARRSRELPALPSSSSPESLSSPQKSRKRHHDDSDKASDSEQPPKSTKTSNKED